TGHKLLKTKRTIQREARDHFFFLFVSSSISKCARNSDRTASRRHLNIRPVCSVVDRIGSITGRVVIKRRGSPRQRAAEESRSESSDVQWREPKRREFITLLGGAAVAWPVAARAQQSGMPLIGFLSSLSLAATERFVAAFRQALRESGYVEGKSLTVEYRWAEGQYDRLPPFAA